MKTLFLAITLTALYVIGLAFMTHYWFDGDEKVFFIGLLASILEETIRCRLSR